MFVLPMARNARRQVRRDLLHLPDNLQYHRTRLIQRPIERSASANFLGA
jgi:hypothetical protein